MRYLPYTPICIFSQPALNIPSSLALHFFPVHIVISIDYLDRCLILVAWIWKCQSLCIEAISILPQFSTAYDTLLIGHCNRWWIRIVQQVPTHMKVYPYSSALSADCTFPGAGAQGLTESSPLLNSISTKLTFKIRSWQVGRERRLNMRSRACFCLLHEANLNPTMGRKLYMSSPVGSYSLGGYACDTEANAIEPTAKKHVLLLQLLYIVKHH